MLKLFLLFCGMFLNIRNDAMFQFLLYQEHATDENNKWS